MWLQLNLPSKTGDSLTFILYSYNNLINFSQLQANNSSLCSNAELRKQLKPLWRHAIWTAAVGLGDYLISQLTVNLQLWLQQKVQKMHLAFTSCRGCRRAPNSQCFGVWTWWIIPYYTTPELAVRANKRLDVDMHSTSLVTAQSTMFKPTRPKHWTAVIWVRSYDIAPYMSQTGHKPQLLNWEQLPQTAAVDQCTQSKSNGSRPDVYDQKSLMQELLNSFWWLSYRDINLNSAVDPAIGA